MQGNKTVIFTFRSNPVCFVHVLLNGLDMQLLLSRERRHSGATLQFAAILLLGLFLLLPGAGCTKKQSEKALAQEGFITDYAGLLSKEDKARLSASLAAYERETCHEVLVLIVPTLGGEEIRELTQRTAIAWDIGQKGFGNGILLTISINETKMRLDSGSAFQWFIEQGEADRILNQVIGPKFSQGKFTEGIEQGLAEIMQVARLKVIPPENRPDICRE
jgi:uncharacterized protein